ncbi:VMAP-C domain-containing protein [Streptomyces sp. NPDC004082]|uniref:VMAP-C domain-containing protein n=2 Tax=unclassified Streptomyces TaxID=2593676 RepID=UPI0036886BBA
MDDLDRAVKSAHAALYRNDAPRAVGGGVLVTPDHVLTCAHVINQILGRPSFCQERPAESGEVVEGVSVALPGGSVDQCYEAALAGWLPARRGDGRPAQEGDVEWFGDLALLRLQAGSTLPHTPPDIGQCRVGSVNYAWFGSGAPSTIVAAVAQGVTDKWIVLDCPASAQSIVEGYSGSPLWDREQQRVVGLVVSRRGERAFAVPIWNVASLFAADRTEADGLAPAVLKQDPRRAAITQQLLGPLRACLPSAASRIECAERLTGELGPAGGPAPLGAPYEWFARTALSSPRGVPTLLALLDAFAGTEDDRRWIRTTALHTTQNQFLTASEHRELLHLLSGSVPSPQGTAARALALGPSLAALDWPDAVILLERYRSHRGKVPHLLRVIEFAAAYTADADTRHALYAWNDSLSRRLGLAENLREYRAQAMESVEAAVTAAPLVQLQLWRVADTETFSFVLYVSDADGSVTHHRTQDRPVPLRTLLEELAAVLETLAAQSAPGALPVIECFVPPSELDLPFDQWIYQADDIFPAVLGQDFLCVLRCPELRRPAYLPELRYRWQALLSGRVAVLSHHDPAIQERGAATPICAVALACPPSELVRLRVIALAVGVPGVLWLRPTESRSKDDELAELTEGLSPHALPRRVYEARLRAAPGEFGARLALVWDRPDGVPQTLRLSDPSL